MNIDNINKDYQSWLQRVDETDLKSALQFQCGNNRLDIVRYILTSPDIHIKIDLNEKNGGYLNTACKYDNLDTVQFLLTSPELSHHADLMNDDGEAFFLACKNNHFAIIEYLLTSTDLKKNFNIHHRNDFALSMACGRGHLDLVKYFLTSPNLKEHASHYPGDDNDNDNGFYWACKENRMNIIDYLLFDYKINNIEKIIKDTLQEEFLELDIFNKLQKTLLSISLHETLPEGHSQVSKVKL